MAYNDALAQLEALGNRQFKKKKKKKEQSQPTPKAVTEKLNIMKGIGVQAPQPKTALERIIDKPLPTSAQDFRVTNVGKPSITRTHLADTAPVNIVQPKPVYDSLDEQLQASGLPGSQELLGMGIEPSFAAKHPIMAKAMLKTAVPASQKINQFHQETTPGKFLDRASRTATELVTGQPSGAYDYGKPVATGNKALDIISDLVGTVGGFATPGGIAAQAMAPSRLVKDIPQVAGAVAKAGKFAKPAERAISGLAGGATFGATQGIIEGGDAKDVAQSAAEDALIFGALEVGLPYFGAALKKFAEKTGKPITDAAIRFKSKRAGKAIQPLDDFIITSKKFPEQLRAEGWEEFHPNSGIWLRRDPKTGGLIDQYYEPVYIMNNRGVLEEVKKYKLWRQGQQGAQEGTSLHDVAQKQPGRDITPEPTGLAISGKVETPKTPVGDIGRTPMVAQLPDRVATAPEGATGNIARRQIVPIRDMGKPTITTLPERVAQSPYIGDLGRAKATEPVNLEPPPKELITAEEVQVRDYKDVEPAEILYTTLQFDEGLIPPEVEPFVDEPMPDTKEGVEALQEVVEGKIAEFHDIANAPGTSQWLYDEIRSRNGIAIKKGDAFYTEYSENLPANIRSGLTNKNGLPFDEMADELGMSAAQLLEQLGDMGRRNNVTKSNMATTRKEIIAELRSTDSDFDRAYTELEEANIKTRTAKKVAPKVEAVKPAEEAPKQKTPPVEPNEPYPVGTKFYDNKGRKVSVKEIDKRGIPSYVVTDGKLVWRYSKDSIDGYMGKQDIYSNQEALQKSKDEFKQRVEREQQREVELQQRKEEAENIGDFYADKSPMQRARAKKTLSKQLVYNGVAMSRKQYIDKAFNEGKTVEKNEIVNNAVVNEAKEKLRFSSGAGLDSINTSAKRERELRAIIDNPPVKIEYRLILGDSTFHVITKTEYEYYNHLAGQKNNPAKDVTPKAETAAPAEAKKEKPTDGLGVPKETKPKKETPAWQQREDTIAEKVKASKEGGVEHLDQAPWGVEYLRGKTIRSLRDDITAKIITVTNRNDAIVEYPNEEAAKTDLGATFERVGNTKRKGWVGTINAHEREEWVIEKPQAQAPKEPVKPTDGLGVPKETKPKKETPKKSPVGDTGKPKQEPTEAYKKASSFISRISKGEPATLDEVKAEVEHIFANDEAITAELKGMTNKELDKLLPWTKRGRYKKKDELVEAVADGVLTDTYYEVSGSNSLTIQSWGRGEWKKEVKQQIQDALDKHTPETWEKLQADTRKEYEEAVAEHKTRLEGVKTPKTLDDFRTASKLRKLTPEEKDTYEDLLARENKADRLKRKQMDAERKVSKASAVMDNTDNFTITKDKHTKTGEDVWIVKLNERVEAEEWKAVNSAMKSLGGNWWRGNQGWNFKADPTEQLDVGKKLEAKAEAKQESNVSKLLKVADNMQKDIDGRLAPRLANTPKRARQAASMAEDAERLQVLQQTIRNLADGIESGEVELLTNIDAKIQIETLDRVLHLAQWERISELNLTYNERLAEQGKPYTVEDIRYAKFPAEEVHVNTINSIIGDINGKKGYMQIAARFKKAVANAKNDYVQITGQLREDLEKVAKAKITKGMLVEDLMQEQKRLERMGIESEAELRAYLREYINYRGEVKIDPGKAIKEKERALIGQDIAGYFPTPKAVVDKMLDAAEISEGMDVLEPSAGKGNIADAIGKPDVIEVNSQLKEILNDKGHNLVANDFLKYTSKEYDRIVMNPPFEKGQDIDHVKHAYGLLKPGGRIVAIMSEGPFFRGDKKATAFRDWLDEVGTSEKLPDGSFKDSERSTGVNTRMVVIDKPTEAKKKTQPTDGLGVTKKEEAKTEAPKADMLKGVGDGTNIWDVVDKKMFDKLWPSNDSVFLDIRTDDAGYIGIRDLALQTVEKMLSDGTKVKLMDVLTRSNLARNWGQDKLQMIGRTDDKYTQDRIKGLRDTGKEKPTQQAGKKEPKKETVKTEEIEKPTVTTRNRTTASIQELADDYKAKGMDRYMAWDQFIIDRGLKPEVDAKDFYEVFDNATPILFREIEVSGKITPTHILTEAYGDLQRRVQVLGDHEKFVEWIDEKGSTSSTPKQYIKSLEPIKKTQPLDGIGVQGFSGKKEMKPTEPTQTEPVRKKDIIDFLSDKLDIPVRVGRYNKRGAKGIFKVKPEVVRTRLAEDIEVTAHEIGHYLDKKLGLSDMPFEEEMAKLAHGFEGAVREEGTAQFINYYLTNPDKAKRLAPGYYEAFQDKMKDNPEIAEILETAQGQIKTWLEQPSKARILGSLSIGETQAKKPMTVDRVVTAWFDQLRPIDAYVKDITKGEKIPDAENPYITARLANGWTGKAEAYLTFGQFDKNLDVVGPSLKEILKSAGDLDNFRTVLVAKRVLELGERGIETGIEPSDAKRAIREIREEAGDKGLRKILKAQKELLEFQDYTLGLLVDAGILLPEAKTKMRELHKDYVPFYRVFDDSASTARFSGKKFANLTSPVKKMKGSGRTIIDPLESIINNTYMYTSVAERQKVGRAIVELAEKFEGSGKWVEEIPTGMYATEFSLNEIKRVLTEAGVDAEGVNLEQMARIFRPSSFISGKDNVITVFRDGEMKLYQLDPDLYRATLFLDEASTGLIEKMLSAPTRTLRAGATGLNLEFAVRNPVRDQWSAAINSHYGYVPGIDLIRGLAHMLKKDKAYQKFFAAGGAHGNLVSGDRKYNQTVMRQLLRSDDFKGQLKNVIFHPIDLLRAISEIGETAPRIQEVARGLKTDDSIEKVMMSARELSLDFAKGGNISKELNRVIAFFNAQALDLHRVQERFKEDPKKAYWKSLALITVPSVILYGINRDNRWWHEKKRWEKDIFWLVPKSADPQEKDFWRIPKPFTLGILFGTMPERFIEFVDTQDRKAFDDLWETVKSNMLFDAVPDKDFMGFPPGLIPTAMLPIIEAFANKSSFTGYDIVPQSEQSLAPEEQYNVYTSETAKIIGKAMGVSPRKVDSIVYGYTAGLGRSVVAGIDKILHAAGVGQDLKPDRGALDAPIIRGFMSKSGATTGSADTIDRFYKLYNETETLYRTSKKKYERGEKYTLTKEDEAKLLALDALRSINGYLREIRKVEKEVLGSTKITPKQKAQALEALNIEEVNYVRNAFGMEPLN